MKSIDQTIRYHLNRYFDNLHDQEPKNLYQMLLDQVEKPLLETVLQRCSHNQTTAAQCLGISRITLRSRMKKYNML